jgi:hypothetical protein
VGGIVGGVQIEGDAADTTAQPLGMALAQHGNHRRQPAAAHTLLLLSRPGIHHLQ